MPAKLLGNFVWEGTLPELPSYEEGARDGHIYKCLDTGESYIRRYGEWILINLGLSQIAATKSGYVITNSEAFAHVTFNTPFLASDYSVVLSVAGSPWPYMACFAELTPNGFDIYTRDTRNGSAVGNRLVSWLCTRDYNP